MIDCRRLPRPEYSSLGTGSCPPVPLHPCITGPIKEHPGLFGVKSVVRGFSLIEVLCALVISIISVSVLVQLCVHYKKIAAQESALASVQENGRFGLFLLSQVAARAGFVDGGVWHSGVMVYGEGKGLPSHVRLRAKAGADVFMVQQADKSVMYFYIKATSRKDVLGNKIYALYQKEAQARYSEELISGVQAMRIYAFTRSASGMLEKRLPAQVGDWRNVYAIQVMLLLVSEHPAYAIPRDYWFDGQRHIAPDGRLYKSMQVIMQPLIV